MNENASSAEEALAIVLAVERCVSTIGFSDVGAPNASGSLT